MYTKTSVALVVGHSRERRGASNITYGITEYDFNRMIAKWIERCGNIKDLKVVFRDTYSELPSKINRMKPKMVLSLHCNAYKNKSATGSEVLYYHTSSIGKQIAEITLENIVEVLGLADRGVKGIEGNERGGYLLRNTVAPCIIAEPFFITNDSDYKIVYRISTFT